MPVISRRTLLGRSVLGVGVLAGVGLGLTKGVHHKVALPPAAPPARLTAALEAHRTLLAGYDTVLKSSSSARLKALRSDVAAQVGALRALLEHYPGWRYETRGTGTPSASPTTTAPTTEPPPASAAGLATRSAAQAGRLRATVLAWPSGTDDAEQVLTVLGSIAAALDTHVTVLR